MKLQGPILVGVDFSAASDQALRQGIDLANGLGTNLIVCHVVPELDTVNILFPQFADRNAEHRQTLIDKALAAVERQIATRLGDAASNVRAVVELGNTSRRVARSGRRGQSRSHRAGSRSHRRQSGTTRDCTGADRSPFPSRHRGRRNRLLRSLTSGVGSRSSGSSAPGLTTPAPSRRRRWDIRACGCSRRSRASIRAWNSRHFASGDRRPAESGPEQASRSRDAFRYRWRGDCEGGAGGPDHRRSRSFSARRARRRGYTRSNRPFAVDARQYGRSGHSVGHMLGAGGSADCMTLRRQRFCRPATAGVWRHIGGGTALDFGPVATRLTMPLRCFSGT